MVAETQLDQTVFTGRLRFSEPKRQLILRGTAYHAWMRARTVSTLRPWRDL